MPARRIACSPGSASAAGPSVPLVVPARTGARRRAREPARCPLRRSAAGREVVDRRRRDYHGRGVGSGTAVDRAALRRGLRTPPGRRSASTSLPARPVVTTAEAESAAATIERLLDGPRRVRAGDAVATLTPSGSARSSAREREDGALGVTLDPKGLAASLRVRLGDLEVPPRDATSRASGAAPGSSRRSPGRSSRSRADLAVAHLEPRLDDPSRAVLADRARVHDRGTPRRSTSASWSRSSRRTTRAASRA